MTIVCHFHVSLLLSQTDRQWNGITLSAFRATTSLTNSQQQELKERHILRGGRNSIYLLCTTNEIAMGFRLDLADEACKRRSRFNWSGKNWNVNWTISSSRRGNKVGFPFLLAEWGLSWMVNRTPRASSLVTIYFMVHLLGQSTPVITDDAFYWHSLWPMTMMGVRVSRSEIRV